MKFSICIPNYNYERYLPRTLRSVLGQEGVELEVRIADNASTDGSVAAARALDDGRVHVEVNRCNVGFAGNLDRAARHATGELMVMLSSDDLVRPGALAAYRALYEAVGTDGVIVCSSADQIDPDDAITGRIGPDRTLFLPEDLVTGLPLPACAKLYRVDARELLRRSLLQVKNPFNFLSTCYPRALWEALEGYGGGRTINPDKWFHWRLLGAAKEAYFLDAPLFAYRWHPQNQTALQKQSGALKYLVDDYVSTFELDAKLLAAAGLTRAEVEAAWMEYDIARHGLATLARGEAVKARRALLFGAATYPGHAARNWKVWALAGLALAGPVGERVAKAANRRRGQGGA